MNCQMKMEMNQHISSNSVDSDKENKHGYQASAELYESSHFLGPNFFEIQVKCEQSQFNDTIPKDTTRTKNYVIYSEHHSEDREIEIKNDIEKDEKLTDFSDGSYHLKHLISPARETNIKCSQCNQYFSQNCFVRLTKTHSGDKPYQCIFCDKDLLQNPQLKVTTRVLHIKCRKCNLYYPKNRFMRLNATHSKEKPYQCFFCDKFFLQNLQPKITVKQHYPTRDTNIECSLCNQYFSPNYFITPSENNPNQCIFCDKVFLQNSQLKSHMPLLPDKELFKCSHCDSVFSDNVTLQKHLLTHSVGNPLQCIHCDKSFSDKFQLLDHIVVHTGETFQCRDCEIGFSNEKDLIGHLLTHNDSTQFQYTYTKQDFSRSVIVSHLIRDQIKNIGEKLYERNSEGKFQCRYCDKIYSIKSYLKKHMVIHTGEKRRFECSQCDKAYLYRRDLDVHFKVHRDKQTYKCNQCDKAFTDNIHLNDHIVTHMEGTPYLCIYCDKIFRFRHCLTRHMQTHTLDEPLYPVYECI